MNTKIAVNLKSHTHENRVKLSEAIQKIAFAVGFTWAGGQIPKYTNSEALIFRVTDSSKVIKHFSDFDKESYRERNPSTPVIEVNVPSDAVPVFLALTLLATLADMPVPEKDNDEEISEVIEGVNVKYCKHGCLLDPSELLTRVETEAKRRASEKFGVAYRN